MKTTSPRGPATRLALDAQTAADLMTPNAVSIPADASVKDAVAFFTNRGFSAAPVIDEAGRPVGVLSQADILIYDRENAAPAATGGACVRADAVRDLMTPVVFSVSPDTPAPRVIEELLALRVHRLFVVDADGVLIGVISALDILQRVRPWGD